MALGTAFVNKLLEHIVGKTQFTLPTNVWVSAHTGDPGTTGVNEHGATAGYLRVQTAPANWNSAATGTIDNSADIAFPTATADYSANITHFALWLHATSTAAGDYIGGGALTAPKSVLNKRYS